MTCTVASAQGLILPLCQSCAGYWVATLHVRTGRGCRAARADPGAPILAFNRRLGAPAPDVTELKRRASPHNGNIFLRASFWTSCGLRPGVALGPDWGITAAWGFAWCRARLDAVMPGSAWAAGLMTAPDCGSSGSRSWRRARRLRRSRFSSIFSIWRPGSDVLISIMVSLLAGSVQTIPIHHDAGMTASWPVREVRECIAAMSVHKTPMTGLPKEVCVN